MGESLESRVQRGDFNLQHVQVLLDSGISSVRDAAIGIDPLPISPDGAARVRGRVQGYLHYAVHLLKRVYVAMEEGRALFTEEEQETFSQALGELLEEIECLKRAHELFREGSRASTWLSCPELREYLD